MTRHCLKTKIKKNFQQHGTFKMMRFEWNEFFFCKKLVLKTVQTHKLLHLYLEKPKRFNTKKKENVFLHFLMCDNQTPSDGFPFSNL